MKKFYTLLAAAAVTVGSLSAQKAASVKVINDAPVKMAAKALMPAKQAQTLKVAKAAPTMMDMTGEYIFSTTVANGNASVNVATLADQNNTDFTITLKGFMFEDAEDLTCDLISNQTGTIFGFEIPGGGTVTLFTSEGTEYKLWLFEEDATDGPTIYNDGIQFIYDADSEKFVMNFQDPTIGVAWVDATGRGNWCFQPELLVPNGVFTGTEYLDGNGNTEAANYPVYGKYESRFGKNTLTVTNIAGCPVPLALTVADGKATATNALAANIAVDYNANTGYTYAPFYYLNDTSSSDYVVSADCYNNADGKTELLFGEHLMAFNDEYGWAARVDNAKVVFNTGFLAAINNVAADFDENAPVEYFNLQGVRVENPANGLYIQRQGNKVAKVIL